MMGRRKRAHSVGDQPKLKSLRSLLTSTAITDDNSRNKDANTNIDSDTVVLPRQEMLSQSQSQQENIDDPLSSQSSDIRAEVLDTVLNLTDLNSVRTEFLNLVKTVFELKETVRKQQISINELLSVVNTRFTGKNDSLSVINVQNAESHSLSTISSSAATYSAAVASSPVLQESSTKPTLNETVRRAVLTAVHTEMQSKQARERNIVITGLRRSNTIQDKDVVSTLVFDEFGMDVSIMQCKRLGKSPTTNDGRPQPLRVVLQSASIVKDIVSSAKYLRRSFDEYIRGNVFINADLTCAEAEAAYHARCERRHLQQLKPKSKPATSEPSVHQQQQLASLVTSSVSSSQLANDCNANASVNVCSIVDGSSSSRCFTVTADVHHPMSASQVFPGSGQSGLRPGPFLVPPPSVLSQQGLATGSVTLPASLPMYSNPQITTPLHSVSPASFPVFQSLENPNANSSMQPFYQPTCSSSFSQA